MRKVQICIYSISLVIYPILIVSVFFSPAELEIQIFSSMFMTVLFVASLGLTATLTDDWSGGMK